MENVVAILLITAVWWTKERIDCNNLLYGIRLAHKNMFIICFHSRVYQESMTIFLVAEKKQTKNIEKVIRNGID